VDLDVVLLSRLQFALTIMFHYLFPPLTIGLGVVLVHLDFWWMRTGDPLYGRAARFWTRIFALTFALGVATGIVMEFQFGTNWADYSRFVGDVFGSALAAEGIFAFFLESGFLAVLVFGWDRVGPRLHFFSTCMVALGSIFSSVWIVIANSWQQTPAGHRIAPILRDGEPWVVAGELMRRAEIVDFWAMVLNPSTVHRLVHVWIGCFILGAFFVMSISAWYLLRGRHHAFADRSFRGALVLGTLAALAAPVSGHLQAGVVAATQPAKLATFEGHFETGPGDLSLFGLPDEEAGTLRFALSVPGALSWLLHGDATAEVTGLDRFRPEDRPPLRLSFASYHLMVGLGLFFLAVTAIACVFWWRGSLFRQRWLLWIFVFAVLGAFAANQAGWVAAEVGRQPWVVHPPVPRDADGALRIGASGTVEYDETLGLRTRDGASAAVSGGQVLGSLALFGLIYAMLFALWIFLLNDKIQKGPDEEPLPERASAGPRGLLDAAGRRPVHAASLTDAERDVGGGI
jgi:cytochrome d ubiquinol oxidase subunit I